MKRVLFLAVLFGLGALAQDTSVTITATGPLGDQKAVQLAHKTALVTYSVGNGAADGSGVAVVNVAITNKTAQFPAGLQFDLSYTLADVSTITFDLGPAAIAAQKSIQCAAQTPTPTTGTIRCLITGINANTIQDGVVAVATVQTMLTSQSQTTLVLLGTVSANLGGNEIPSTVAPGGGVITMAATVASLGCTQTDIWNGLSVTCTVALNKPAPASGTLVTLASSNTSIVTVPANVTISQGTTSATFQAVDVGP